MPNLSFDDDDDEPRTHLQIPDGMPTGNIESKKINELSRKINEIKIDTVSSAAFKQRVLEILKSHSFKPIDPPVG